MADYALELEAENDLLEIGRYTARTWGLEQTDRYLSKLDEHFLAVSEGKVHAREFLKERPDLLYSHCQHHYVFFARDEHGGVVILAVFHENMDLMVRLKERLQL
jgi:plasmid stabilization system protein ParE